MDTYEKKYKDILARLEEAKNDNDVCDERYCCVINDIIPELNESEDEKIRKALIRFHKSTIDIDGIIGDEIVSWLEKQGGQILANSCKTCKDEQKPIKWDEYDEMYVAALVTMVKNHCTTDDKLKNELIGWLVSLKTSIK